MTGSVRPLARYAAPIAWMNAVGETWSRSRRLVDPARRERAAPDA